MSGSSKEAFAALIQPHFDRLYRLAYRFAGNRADAEDLVQDVLVKVYERRDELGGIRDLAPWLGRVLYNQFVDGARRYRRSPVRLAGDDGGIEAETAKGADPADRHAMDEDLARLERAVRRLGDDHRHVLLLHDVEGYSLPEIEELTGVPLGTLKSRLHRARARLRELLAPALPAGNSADAEKNLEPFAPPRRAGG